MPILESITTTALDRAVNLGMQHLKEASDEAKRTKKYNVASCIKFLDAARTAVLGLEDEVDEILIEGALVSRDHWQQRSDLFKRIQTYLNRDQIRPILDGALQGISACYSFAVEDTDGFLQRKEQKRQKAESVEALLELFGSLSDYLKKLNGRMKFDVNNYVGRSGIDLKELLELQEHLDDSLAKPKMTEAKDRETRQQKIRTLVEAAQQKRQRAGLPLAAETKKVMQELTVAFRLDKIP
jgi:hypothetical protein